MSQFSYLKAATSLREVAHILGYKPKSLSYLLYVKQESQKYSQFEIPKKNGGVRSILAPSDDLKYLQRKLAETLQNCQDEIRQANGKAKVDNLSHGFRRNRSILTNSTRHRNKRYVFNIDIKDFFDSINFGRVRGFFISDRNFELHPKVATIIAQIACFENKLPQGSPCSPVISNLIGHILDMRLVRLSKRVGCTYSRYADDLTFSTNKKVFPSEIAYQSSPDSHVWFPGDRLSNCILNSGFRINSKKTRMQYKNSRQEVTGLVVNNRINVRTEYRRNVRAMVHRLITTGKFVLPQSLKKDSSSIKEQISGDIYQLHGMLGFIDSVDRFKSKRNKKDDLTGQEKLYRKFLLYKEFYIAKKPVLVCEGKTDNIYITHAIRSLAKDYPDLATINEKGEVTIDIRRFKYTESSTGQVLGLNSGGTGVLKNLILNYKKESSCFCSVDSQSPVIILVDNDKAGREVFSTAKEVLNQTTNPQDIFIHLFKNLYLMATPTRKGSQKSEIEDLFDKSIKDITIGKRTFTTDNKSDPKTQYGKAEFAYKIIEKQSSEIDFSGFKPLLDKFVAVIKHHNSLQHSQ